MHGQKYIKLFAKVSVWR